MTEPTTEAGRRMLGQLRGARFSWEQESDGLTQAAKDILAIEQEAGYAAADRAAREQRRDLAARIEEQLREHLTSWHPGLHPSLVAEIVDIVREEAER